VHFLRCVQAEWLLVTPRITRTRCGVLLLALAITLVSLRSRGLDPFVVALLVGALGAVVAAGFAAGLPSERASMALALTHPTSSLAIALGRWLAAFVPAAALTAACGLTVASAGASLAGLAAAGAVSGLAVAVVLAWGPSAAAALFLFMAVAGAVPPERLIALSHPGVLRLGAASVLELGPALWHYRDIGAGDVGAIIHSITWAGLGVFLASAVIASRRVR
jgi:hypothetical protein